MNRADRRCQKTRQLLRDFVSGWANSALPGRNVRSLLTAAQATKLRQEVFQFSLQYHRLISPHLAGEGGKLMIAAVAILTLAGALLLGKITGQIDR